MSDGSSTPETAAAPREVIRRIYDNSTIADDVMDALSRAGFTVVSGGEGLQHGAPDMAAIEEALRISLALADRVPREGLVGELAENATQAIYGVMRREWFASGAAPGTAEPAHGHAVVIAKGGESCAVCGGAIALGSWRHIDRAAGATAPETTDPCARFVHDHSGFAEYGCPACDCYESEALNAAPETTPAACVDCGGHGVRVNPWATEQEALEGLNVAQCPSCSGSGVAETTP